MSYFSLITQPITTSQGYSFTVNGQSSTHVNWGVILAFLLVSLIFGLFYIVCLWKIFKKAGRPGWAAIVPVYNTWVTAEIAGKPGWWSLIFLIPFINIIGLVLFIIVDIALCKRFGKSVWFAIFLIILLPIIGLPILAFGKAKYSADGSDNEANPQHLPINPTQTPQSNAPVLPPSPASTIAPTINPTVPSAAPIVGNDMQPPPSQTVAPVQQAPQPVVDSNNQQATPPTTPPEQHQV